MDAELSGGSDCVSSEEAASLDVEVVEVSELVVSADEDVVDVSSAAGAPTLGAAPVGSAGIVTRRSGH